MTVPVLRALVAQHPEVKITVVSRVFYKPIFKNIPNVNFFSAHVHYRHKGLLGLFRLYKDLKSKGVTEFADLHNVLRSEPKTKFSNPCLRCSNDMPPCLSNLVFL